MAGVAVNTTSLLLTTAAGEVIAIASTVAVKLPLAFKTLNVTVEVGGAAICTVTVHSCFVVPSSAVTVYVTGDVKFAATPVSGEIVAPSESVMVGISALTSVQNGTVRFTV